MDETKSRKSEVGGRKVSVPPPTAMAKRIELAELNTALRIAQECREKLASLGDVIKAATVAQPSEDPQRFEPEDKLALDAFIAARQFARVLELRIKSLSAAPQAH